MVIGRLSESHRASIGCRSDTVWLSDGRPIALGYRIALRYLSFEAIEAFAIDFRGAAISGAFPETIPASSVKPELQGRRDAAARGNFRMSALPSQGAPRQCDGLAVHWCRQPRRRRHAAARRD